VRARIYFRESWRAGSNRHAASGREVWNCDQSFLLDCAIPAMVFVGVFMMPFIRLKARSVPEYLRLAFYEKTRALNPFPSLHDNFFFGHFDVRDGAADSNLHLFDAPLARLGVSSAGISRFDFGSRWSF